MTSMLELARAQRPGVPDEDLVVAIADQLIQDFDLTPPVPLEVVAGIQGVRKVDRVPLDVAACLVPEPTGAVIKLRSTDSLERQNFSGFHEIGHTFMPGYHLEVQTRCDPGRTVARDPIEALCDFAASELLLPRKFVIPDLASSNLDFETANDLGVRYGASLEATARRMASLWPGGPALLLRLEICNKPRDRVDAEPCLRASSFVPAGPAWPAIHRYKSLAKDDPLQAVLHQDAFSGSSSLRGLTDGSQPFHVEAVYSPWSDGSSGQLRQRVLAFISPVTNRSVTHG